MCQYEPSEHLQSGQGVLEIMKKLADILAEEKLITELEDINLKKKIEKYGGTL